MTCFNLSAAHHGAPKTIERHILNILPEEFRYIEFIRLFYDDVEENLSQCARKENIFKREACNNASIDV